MTNNTDTLNGSLKQLGITMAANLTTQGVPSTYDEGLTTLAGKILDIEPSLDLDTSVSISVSSHSVTVGDSIELGSKLIASYDDTSLVDVDLSGVLQNATIKYYNGNTLIGTGVTGLNGVCTCTYVTDAVGTLSIRAVFEGTDNFNDCVSGTVNVVVSAPSVDALSVSSSKDILSYNDRDSCTLYCQLMSEGSPVAVSGESVSFNVYKKSDDTLVETLTDDTDASGLASVSYSSKHAGDLYVECSCMSLVQRYDIQDCYRYDDASSDKTSRYGSLIAYRGGGSGTWNYNSTNGYYGIITGDNEVMVELSELTGKDDFTIEFDALFNANDNNFYGLAGICAYEDNNNYSRLSCHNKTIAQRVCVNGSANESESNVLTTVSRYDILHYKFTISNNQIIEEVTRGTTLIGTRTISYTPTSNTKYGIGLIWGTKRVKDTFLKNIKVKPL